MRDEDNNNVDYRLLRKFKCKKLNNKKSYESIGEWVDETYGPLRYPVIKDWLQKTTEYEATSCFDLLTDISDILDKVREDMDEMGVSVEPKQEAVKFSFKSYSMGMMLAVMLTKIDCVLLFTNDDHSDDILLIGELPRSSLWGYLDSLPNLSKHIRGSLGYL